MCNGHSTRIERVQYILIKHDDNDNDYEYLVSSLPPDNFIRHVNDVSEVSWIFFFIVLTSAGLVVVI